MLLEATSGPSIYRQRARLVEDSYGDLIESWDEPAEVRLRYAKVELDKLMRTTEVDASDEDTTKTQAHLYYSGPVEIVETDRIRFGSEVWRVNGMAVSRQSLASGAYTHAKLIRFTDK